MACPAGKYLIWLLNASVSSIATEMCLTLQKLANEIKTILKSSTFFFFFFFFI